MPYAQPQKKSHTTRNVVLAVIGVLVLLMGGCTIAVIAASGKAVNDAVNELASPSSTQEHDKATPSSSKNARSGEQSSQEMTTSQENALESAQSYLDMSGFSRTGLIEQLSSQAGEGFPKADAVWAVNQVDVDWNKEAVEAAK